MTCGDCIPDLDNHCPLCPRSHEQDIPSVFLRANPLRLLSLISGDNYAYPEHLQHSVDSNHLRLEAF
jgi:hypothetical protein